MPDQLHNYCKFNKNLKSDKDKNSSALGPGLYFDKYGTTCRQLALANVEKWISSRWAQLSFTVESSSGHYSRMGLLMNVFEQAEARRLAQRQVPPAWNASRATKSQKHAAILTFASLW
ncbi:conserved hypothetical protein [Coccidioides posadasii str. Silveira]|uniref:Uncharacterized protein n=2 Tax=Coccidioides posadasii TaxID=199306 RepID=E9D893_COCPS|nr:conserved hypothetical protein [Coccidioides posadasii str. Silveira]KMM70757.1 hypothetical protein CPAG_07068 [Coccidioides posadasii RMSCC 3488]